MKGKKIFILCGAMVMALTSIHGVKAFCTSEYKVK